MTAPTPPNPPEAVPRYTVISVRNGEYLVHDSKASACFPSIYSHDEAHDTAARLNASAPQPAPESGGEAVIDAPPMPDLSGYNDLREAEIRKFLRIPAPTPSPDEVERVARRLAEALHPGLPWDRLNRYVKIGLMEAALAVMPERGAVGGSVATQNYALRDEMNSMDGAHALVKHSLEQRLADANDRVEQHVQTIRDLKATLGMREDELARLRAQPPAAPTREALEKLARDWEANAACARDATGWEGEVSEACSARAAALDSCAFQLSSTLMSRAGEVGNG